MIPATWTQGANATEYSSLIPYQLPTIEESEERKSYQTPSQIISIHFLYFPEAPIPCPNPVRIA